tara:strand:+ start:505 stop:1032 length:528 start_codon:yes stop_codon:yes gene_type:complete
MLKLFVAAIKEETVGLNKFFHTGVGKINATIKLIELINEYKPSKIINYGTAGALKKNLKGLVKCTTFVQRDMDARGLMNLKLGETPFDSISTIESSNDGYVCGTGDSFVNNEIEIACDIVDMEAYALAKVSKIYNIDFECYKYISDYADQNSKDDWHLNCSKGVNLFEQKFPESK